MDYHPILIYHVLAPILLANSEAILQTQIQMVHLTVNLDVPGGEEACHGCFRIGGVTGHQLGESEHFQFGRLLQYFLQKICIVVTEMAHIILNQCDGQFVQVKIQHE